MEPCTLDVDGERLLTLCRVCSRFLREWTDVSRLASRTMSLSVWKVGSLTCISRGRVRQSEKFPEIL